MLEFGLGEPVLTMLVLTFFQAREVLESITVSKIPQWKKELIFVASGNIPPLCAKEPVKGAVYQQMERLSKWPVQSSGVFPVQKSNRLLLPLL